MTTPIKSIRAFCYECRESDWVKVKECSDKECPLWIYRMGKNPNRKGIGGRPKGGRRCLSL